MEDDHPFVFICIKGSYEELSSFFFFFFAKLETWTHALLLKQCLFSLPADYSLGTKIIWFFFFFFFLL